VQERPKTYPEYRMGARWREVKQSVSGLDLGQEATEFDVAPRRCAINSTPASVSARRSFHRARNRQLSCCCRTRPSAAVWPNTGPEPSPPRIVGTHRRSGRDPRTPAWARGLRSRGAPGSGAAEHRRHDVGAPGELEFSWFAAASTLRGGGARATIQIDLPLTRRSACTRSRRIGCIVKQA
jgi:hypothetical protein